MGVAPWGAFFQLFERSIFDLNSDTPFFAIFGDFGTKNEVKMVKNLLKIEQNSPKITKMSEIAKVHLDLCFTYPNGSPHDQESTKIGREGSTIHENMLKKRMRQKVTTKSSFSSILGSFWGPRITPKTIKMGEYHWRRPLFRPPGRPGVDFGASEVDLGASGVDFGAFWGRK